MARSNARSVEIVIARPGFTFRRTKSIYNQPYKSSSAALPILLTSPSVDSRKAARACTPSLIDTSSPLKFSKDAFVYLMSESCLQSNGVPTSRRASMRLVMTERKMIRRCLRVDVNSKVSGLETTLSHPRRREAIVPKGSNEITRRYSRASLERSEIGQILTDMPMQRCLSRSLCPISEAADPCDKATKRSWGNKHVSGNYSLASRPSPFRLSLP